MINAVGKGFPTSNIQIGHTFCDIDDLTLWKYIGGDPRLVTSWVLIGGQVTQQPDTTLWGLAQAGAFWFYVPEQTYYGWNGSAIVSIAFGVGLNLYNFRTRFALQEDFLAGGQASGILGGLGLGSTGTTVANAGEVDHVGVYRLETSAVSGTQVRMNFTTSAAFNCSLNHEVTWVIRPLTVDANMLIRIGAANGVSANPPLFGAYFEKLDADANWFCVTALNGVYSTRVDTGIPVSTGSWVALKYVRTASNVQFYIDRRLVATITTPLPIGLISPFAFVLNSAAANKTLAVDYMEIISEVSR